MSLTRLSFIYAIKWHFECCWYSLELVHTHFDHIRIYTKVLMQLDTSSCKQNQRRRRKNESVNNDLWLSDLPDRNIYAQLYYCDDTLSYHIAKTRHVFHSKCKGIINHAYCTIQICARDCWRDWNFSIFLVKLVSHNRQR